MMELDDVPYFAEQFRAECELILWEIEELKKKKRGRGLVL